MKIVYINSVCGVGSTGRIVEGLARRDLEAGHQVMIAYGRGRADVEGVRMVRIGTQPELLLHGAESRLLDDHGFGSRWATKRFLKELDAFGPDLIHMHNIHGYYINVEMLFDYIKRHDIRARWTLHDCWAFTGHCSFAGEEIGCGKWRTGCGECPMRDQYPQSLLLDRSRANYARKRRVFTGVRDLTLISPSQWLADRTRESFLREYPVEVVRNDIDLSAFRPTASRFREEKGIGDRFMMLCVGFAWDKWKLADMGRISRALEEDEALVVVGMGEKETSSLAPGTVCIPRTHSKEELARIYSAADVFVNPTYSDNYPTVNLEAEACGTPVVCYDSGGSSETLKREDSLCVPRGDLEALLRRARERKGHEKTR